MAVHFFGLKNSLPIFVQTQKSICFCLDQGTLGFMFLWPKKTDCFLPYRKSMLYFELETSFPFNPRTRPVWSEKLSLDPSTFQIQKQSWLVYCVTKYSQTV